MSILIKGMEMPHDCDECKLCAFIPVGEYGLYRKCLPLNEKAEISIRRKDCPLVPVPPHGRLGDLDALKVKAIERSEKCGVLVNVLDNVITAYDIETAPTIIPATEGET